MNTTAWQRPQSTVRCCRAGPRAVLDVIAGAPEAVRSKALQGQVAGQYKPAGQLLGESTFGTELAVLSSDYAGFRSSIKGFASTVLGQLGVATPAELD